MVGKSVSVVAEWAHLGKTGGVDAGYRLLGCSNGVLTGENFEELLLRYSPGTLSIADLPQITVSWLVGDNSPHYIALAVHYRSEDHRVDIGDREVMMTDYYCVPFDQLARGCVSYLTMYQELGQIQLPVDPPYPIRTDLPAASPADSSSEFAKWVAALLLTTRPVCILGAGGATYSERLWFIDEVASLLPYGMRSRLSASTWTSSTYRDHKLRLFFSDADRNRNDQIAVWEQRGRGPIGDSYADTYLKLLRSGVLFPARLTEDEQRVPSGFDFENISTMVTRLSKPSSSRKSPRSKNEPRDGRPPEPPTVQVPQSVAVGDASYVKRQLPAVDDEPRLTEWLKASVIPLRSGNSQTLENGNNWLQQYRLTMPRSERLWLREFITEEHLLRRELPGPNIAGPQLRRFYSELLKLAYAPPDGHIDYQRYCELESSAGYEQGERLAAPLAFAIQDVGPHGSAWLLLLNSLNDSDSGSLLKDHPLKFADIVGMMVEPSVSPAHARIVCDQARRFLPYDGAGKKADRTAFLEAMRESNLIAILHDRYANDPIYQYSLMRDILKYAYAGSLDRSDVIHIFASLRNTDTPAPTDGLLAAMLPMVKSRDVKVTVRDFAHFRLRAIEFPDEVQAELKNKLWQNASREPKAMHGRSRQSRLLPLRDWPVWLTISVLVLIAVIAMVVSGVFIVSGIHA